MTDNTNEGQALAHPALVSTSVAMKPITFFFKEKKDANGKKTGYRRPALNLNIPIPSAVFLASVISNGITAYRQVIPEGAAIPSDVSSARNMLDLLLNASADIVYNAARQQVNDKDDISQETLDMSKISWEHIANIPPAERKGTGINEETWEDFVKDYVAVMPAALSSQGISKTEEQIATQAEILKKKFAAYRQQKKIVGYMRQMLALWYQHTQQKEDFASVYEYLDGRAEVLLKADEQAVLENI